jgi:IS1 family transposase
VIKTMRRRRLVEVKRHVVVGTKAAVEQVLAACGWLINTSFVERLNLSLRQRVVAIRRRSASPCKSGDGLRHQLVLFQSYHNFGSRTCWLRRIPSVPS